MEILINRGTLNARCTKEILMPLIIKSGKMHLEYYVPQLPTWIATEHLHTYKFYSYFLI